MMTSIETLQRTEQVAKELETISQGRLTAVATSTEGIRVDAALSLDRGTLLVECPAIQIALDPSRWMSHCGFCTASISTSSATTDTTTTASCVCPTCQVIGFCSDCLPLASKIHSHECNSLRLFLELLQTSSSAALSLSSAAAVSSSDTLLLPMDVTSHLLSIRLLCTVQSHNQDPTKVFPTTQKWSTLMNHLYASPISEDELHNSRKIVASCWKNQVSFSDSEETKEVALSSPSQEEYEHILARVLGCSHALTDLTLPLGTQTLGRALFWHHSFYNHACSPNAYLSCSGTTARVHLLRSVTPGESITLSYIPLSGLSRHERQNRLQTNYGFLCDCETCTCTCTSSSSSKNIMDLPQDANVDPIREVQFSCNERLLATSEDPEEDEVESILSLIYMTQRGIKTQNIPTTHEVNLEAHRLLAMGLSLVGRYTESIQHHHEWFEHVIEGLMDPTAMATQRVALARDLAAHTNNHDATSQEEWPKAIQQLVDSIGNNHPWIQRLMEESSQYRASKKARHEE